MLVRVLVRELVRVLVRVLLASQWHHIHVIIVVVMNITIVEAMNTEAHMVVHVVADLDPDQLDNEVEGLDPNEVASLAPNVVVGLVPNVVAGLVPNVADKPVETAKDLVVALNKLPKEPRKFNKVLVQPVVNH